MKKIITAIVCVLGIVATALCFIFPVQAKEVSENITNVLNTPFVIWGTSITLGGILTYIISKYIMTNSRFGRKEIDGLKSDFSECEIEISDYKEKIDEKIAEVENKYVNLEANCNNQVSIMLQQFEEMQGKMLTALEVIPNVKVQNIVNEYKQEYEAKKQEIIDKTINTNSYVDEKLAEMKAQFDEFMEKLKHEKAEDNQTTKE